MNNARVNCPKCQKMFPNQQLLIQHSRKCEKEEVKIDTTEKEDVKMDTTEKEERKTEGFKLEIKDPLGGEKLEISISTPTETRDTDVSVNWDKTEEETMALLKGYNDFIKNNDAMAIDLEKKVQESEKRVLEVSKNSSLSSIEISDDEDDCIPRLPEMPPGMRNSTDMGTFKAPKPPPQPIAKPRPLMPKPRPLPILPRQSLMNRAGAGYRRLDPLQCFYCGQLSPDRISVARHLISSHWAEVRERQGGGRRDNSAYYASIEDNRVIRPEPGKFPRAQPLAQKTSQVMNNVNAATSVANPITSPRWLDKLGGGGSANINKKARQIHNPSWYGKPPNRKIAPRPLVGGKPLLKSKIPFEATFDLTKDDPDACSVCDDDFNWPDENHECKRTRQKDPNKLNSVNRNKVLQPVSVSSNRKGSKTAPISVPIKTGGKDFRNLVKKLSTNSRALQITPVMKK